MRSKANENGVSVMTHAGTIRVLFGFASERLDGKSGEKEWLKAIVPFPGTEREPGKARNKYAPIRLGEPLSALID